MTSFLRALERTGEARTAAEDAGIDHTTAYQRRRTHAEFSAAWEASLERFRAARNEARAAEMGEAVEEVLAEVPSPGSPSASPTSPLPEGGGGDGREYAISNGQLKRVGPGRWSKGKERAFLAELAYSGSVRRACRAIGLSRQAVGQRRRQDPPLDAACFAAIEHARVHLNAFLVEAGNNTFDPDDLPGGEEGTGLPKVTVAEAIRIAQMKGPPGAEAAAGAGAGLPVSDKELCEALAKRLAAFGARVAKERDAWDALKARRLDPSRLGEIGEVRVAPEPDAGDFIGRPCPHCERTVFLSFLRG